MDSAKSIALERARLTVLALQEVVVVVAVVMAKSVHLTLCLILVLVVEVLAGLTFQRSSVA